MSDSEQNQLKAGHPPAMKVGGKRVPLPKHVHEEKPEASNEEEEEVEVQEKDNKNNHNRVVVISGAHVKEKDIYSPEAARAIHDVPVYKPRQEYQPAPAYSAPAQAYPAPAYRKEEYQSPPPPPRPYDFGYVVKDYETENNFEQQETSDGKTISGSYRVNLPDGRVQIVRYKAGENGNVVDVQYEGEARYDPAPVYKKTADYPQPAAPYAAAPAPYAAPKKY